MFLLSAEQPEMQGAYNAVAPHPVTNAALMRELRRTLHRPWSPPVPTPAVRLGALLMGSNALIALTGQRCEPRRFLAQDFPYDFPRLADALQDLLRSRR
jgi:NAD dependent epimerase/dehydratase family enzyme